MPLYEYKCASCGDRFEKIVKFSDPPLEACPKCGGTVEKLLSSPAIKFKGSGWYINDYAKKSSSDTSTSSSQPSSDKPAEKTADKAAGKSGDSGKSDASSSTTASKND